MCQFTILLGISRCASSSAAVLWHLSGFRRELSLSRGGTSSITMLYLRFLNPKDLEEPPSYVIQSEFCKWEKYNYRQTLQRTACKFQLTTRVLVCTPGSSLIVPFIVWLPVRTRSAGAMNCTRDLMITGVMLLRLLFFKDELILEHSKRNIFISKMKKREQSSFLFKAGKAYKKEHTCSYCPSRIFILFRFLMSSSSSASKV